ncbi:MAG: TolC family protein [Proteobacteria bacterium]|nr:TolC family protein [Pseudomonadota bacterium]MBU1584717.1 TolC family protein [Pseudomonadota bacterium]MBU2451979.1 TolC family protein [Pseudomonadota bacterium]MBU2631236.1 TolC family protein [Pseudomonadota bacterium]
MKINIYPVFCRSCRIAGLIWVAAAILTGCQTPGEFRTDVDRQAQRIINEKQAQVLGRQTDFSLEKPSDILRRQILEHTSLPVAGPASLGSDKLPPVAHWPESGYPTSAGAQGHSSYDLNTPLSISLVRALQIGARNNFEFMTKKETVFQSALALYLEQDAFRTSLIGQIQSLVSSDRSQTPSREGTLNSGTITGTRQLENGIKLSTALAVDLATLLTSGSNSSFGIKADASLSIPLLRGSGRHIVTEPMQQAEQNLVYAILDFERFKKKFAVSIGRDYLTILKQMDGVKNAWEDYQSRLISSRRSRRLAEAGRLKEIEVDQSVQTELVARQRWVSAQEQYKKQMDAFKVQLGLPPDADIDLYPDELNRLAVVPDMGAGPLELSERKAVEMALENRYDLQVITGKVFDAQRAVVVAADALGAELTFLGSAAIGERRTITTADLENARLRTDKGVFSALLTLDLGFDRTAEAITYRNSFILLEQAVRNAQSLEDTIKIEIRSRLRELLEARETLVIQAKSVELALKRVKSITLFMDAGRAQTRDLLEAQDALLEAQNSLTSARVNYRIAELEIQRDMGLLVVTDTGLWQEYSPEANTNGKK